MKKALAILLVVLMAIAAIGCGGVEVTSSQPTAAPAEAPADAPEAAEPAAHGTKIGEEIDGYVIGDTLTMYTCLTDGEYQYYLEAFEKATGITVNALRLSAGEMITRVDAEKDNPQASVLFGGSTDNYINATGRDLLDPYTAAGIDKIPANYHDADGVYSPFYVGAICFACNSEIFAENGWEYPTTWQDLLDPKYKDNIVMAHPATSGTAYTVFATVVQLLGEEKAWEYFSGLDANILYYTKAGAAAPSQVGLGEAAIGLTFAHDALQYTTDDKGNLPIVCAFPTEGTGYEVGATALVKGGIKGEEGAARLFIDYVISKQGQDLFSTNNSFRTPVNTEAVVDSRIQPISELAIVDYDAIWAGENKERLCAEFGEKIENKDNAKVLS